MSTMNMDVVVKLVDQLSGPAKNVASSLAAIEKSAARLSKVGRGFNTLAKDFTAVGRGTANFTAGARSIDAFIRSSSRLGGVVSEFTKLTSAVRPATTALRSFSRAATSATAAARSLHGALNVTSGANASIAAIHSQTRALTGLARAQRQVAAGARSGGHRGHSVVPAIAGAAGIYGAGRGIRTIADRAGSLQDEIARLQINGLTKDEQNAVRTRAEGIARKNQSTTVAGNIHGILEARAAMGGDLKHAIDFAEDMSKMSTVMGFVSGKKDRAKEFESISYDLLRSAELRNIINRPDELRAFMAAAMQNYIANGSRLTAKDWHQSAIYGRGSTMGFSQEFWNQKMPFLMQETKSSGGQGGGQAASALVQMHQAVVRGTIASKNVGQWVKYGLVDPKDVVKNKMGQLHIPPGRVKGYDLAQKDPAEWVQKYLLPALEAKGPITPEMKQAQIAGLFGSLKSQQIADVLAIQFDRMNSYVEMTKKALDAGPSLDIINSTFSQSIENLKAKATDFAATIGAAPIEAASAGLRNLADAISYLTNKAGDINGGHNGSDPTDQSFGGQHPYMTMAGAGLLTALFGVGAAKLAGGGMLSRVGGGALGFGLGGPVGGAVGAAVGGGLFNGGLFGAAQQLNIAAMQLQAAAAALGASPAATAAATAGTAGATALGAANVTTLGATVAGAALPVLAAGLGVGFIAAISTDETRRKLTDADSAPKLLPVTPKLNFGTGDGGAGKILQLPDFTSYGVQAGQQVGQGVATGVQNSGGQATGEAQSIMDRIRAIFSVGVDVPVRVQQPNITPPAGGAGALPTPAKPAGGSPPAPVKTGDRRGGDTYNVAVHVSGAGDPNAVARAVHDRFKTAARSQLSDGVYS